MCTQADLVGVSAEEYRRGVQSQVEAMLSDLAFPPVIPVCSLTGYGVEELMNAVSHAYQFLAYFVSALERTRLSATCAGTQHHHRRSAASTVLILNHA